MWGDFPKGPVTPEVAGSSPVGPATSFALLTRAGPDVLGFTRPFGRECESRRPRRTSQ
jgi:hypothetical protein